MTRHLVNHPFKVTKGSGEIQSVVTYAGVQFTHFYCELPGMHRFIVPLFELR